MCVDVVQLCCEESIGSAGPKVVLCMLAHKACTLFAERTGGGESHWCREDDGFIDIDARGIRQTIDHTLRSCGLPYERDVVGIATETVDVLTYPPKGSELVFQSEVDGSGVGLIEIAEDAQPIGDSDGDHLFAQGKLCQLCRYSFSTSCVVVSAVNMNEDGQCIDGCLVERVGRIDGEYEALLGEGVVVCIL